MPIVKMYQSYNDTYFYNKTSFFIIKLLSENPSTECHEAAPS
jgi:hypothetical protein